MSECLVKMAERGVALRNDEAYSESQQAQYERYIQWVEEMKQGFMQQQETMQSLNEDMDKVVETFCRVEALKKISDSAPKRNSHYTPPKKKRKRK